MRHELLGYIFLAFTLSLAGCASSTESGPGGAGGSAGAGGVAGSGGSAGAGGTAGSAGAGGTAGAGGMGGVGGVGGARPCEASGTVSFEFTGPTSDPSQDCIVPGVCISRNRVKALYNTETEVGPTDVSPKGTEWALSTCEAATEDDFTTFVDLIRTLGSGGGSLEGGEVDDLLPGEPLCLRLTNESLLYDVVFSAWGNGGASNFAYERTPFVSDECGVAGATCPDCDCPEGFVNNPRNYCVVPNPCQPNPCGTDAECRRIGAREHRCECDTVEFTRPPGQTTVCDRVNGDICIARAPTVLGQRQGALFNSLQEDASAPSGVCDSEDPRPLDSDVHRVDVQP